MASTLQWVNKPNSYSQSTTKIKKETNPKPYKEKQITNGVLATKTSKRERGATVWKQSRKQTLNPITEIKNHNNGVLATKTHNKERWRVAKLREKLLV